MTEPSQYFKGRTVQEQMNEVIGYVDTRAAEVAVGAIASDMAIIHQEKLDAEAAATNAAASAAAAAGTLTNAVKKTGEASQSIDGDIDLNDDLNVDGDAVIGGTLAVTGAVTVPAPVNNTDAANKKYVDDQDALDAKLTGATFTGQLNASGQRAYSPGNTTDVATIGTLDAYTPMVRTTNDQTVAGLKVFTQYLDGMNEGHYLLSTPRTNDTTDYIKIASWTGKNQAHEFTLIGSEYNTRLSYAKIIALGNIDDNVLSLAAVTNVATAAGSKLSAKLTWNGTEYAIYVKSVNYHEKKVFYNGGFLHNNRVDSNLVTAGESTLVPEPVVGDTFLNVVDMVEMA